MIRSILIILLFWAGVANGATVNTSVYILRDSIHFDNGVSLPYATFNSSNNYSHTNARIVVSSGDQLELWVVNFDTDPHDFTIKGQTNTVSIPVGDSVLVSYACNQPGVFIYHDPTGFPDMASTGLAGMLVVKDDNHQGFFWNIKEHQEGWNATVFSGGSVDWTTYYPEYFTINGNSNPHINADVSARITGNVGDTIMIYIANTGQSIHPMHFHGYHVEIMNSSKNPSEVGWSKDTLPIYPSETAVLQLVPDKEGEYPVHDHNLIGTTGGNMYPMGMFTTILIAP